MRQGLLFSIIVLIIFCAPAFGYDWSTNPGNGSLGNPYQISTPEQLNAIGANLGLWDKHFELSNDIDMSSYNGTEYNIIGNSGVYFRGSFDGKGHVIRNLSYSTTNDLDYVGMFGCTKSATIVNLHLENVRIESSGICVGGIVGYQQYGTILSSSCHGSIKGHINVGILIGFLSYSSVADCYSRGNVVALGSASRNIGGLIGSSQKGTVNRCYSDVELNTDVYNATKVGGLIGDLRSGTISQCYSSGSIETRGTSSFDIGGLVGCHIDRGSVIINCYSNCNIAVYGDRSSNIGGFIGGLPTGDVINCYSTGYINSNLTEKIGGFTGESLGCVINCFWDTQTSGLSYSSSGKGRTTGQMKQATNYVAWNEPGQTYWVIDNGNDYPRLAWQSSLGSPLSAETFSDLIPYGYGTSSNPYQISTPEQFNAIGLFPDYWDKVFALQNNIDMSEINGTDYNIIGQYQKSFKGLFQGNHHTIRNFTYQSEGYDSYVGLFGQSNGDIENLRMQNTQISTRGVYVGGIVGSQSLCTISQCSVNGDIAGNGAVGGLVGCAIHSQSRIESSSSSGSVTSSGYTGGLAGVTYRNSVVNNCYSIANVFGLDHGDHEAGGLVGMLDGTISNSYSAGYVSGESDTGGLVAYKRYGVVSTSFWDIENSNQTNSAGGFGKTTAQMQTLSTFANVGWDFDTIWWIDDGNCYPQLQWELNTLPVANAGDDQLVFAFINGYAEVQLDGTNSYDVDGDMLEYYWYDANELIATVAKPTLFLSIGEYEFTLIVNDGSVDSEPDKVAITVSKENKPPVSNPGVDQVVYAWVDGYAEVQLNGTGSYDADGDELECYWYDANELIATGAEPNVVLPVGEHEITLIVNDGIADSEPDSCVVTVIEPFETTVRMLPGMINLKSGRDKLAGRIEFAGEVTPVLDPNQPMLLLVGDAEIEAHGQKLVYSEETVSWYLMGTFDSAAVIENLLGLNEAEITLVTRFETGQWVYGKNVVKVKQ